MSSAEVVIIGAGPAGLSLAIACALKGVRTVVLERGTLPIDKACGEGVMPRGVAVLESLGVMKHVAPHDTAAFERIEYVLEDGRRAVGHLAAPGGLGIRRTALSRALIARAHEVGVEVREGTSLRAFRRERNGVVIETESSSLVARLLVGADGLHSMVRRAAGLELEVDSAQRRYGLRRHFAVAPWSNAVEVHFAPGVEAYVTPAGVERVGVAFLWTKRAGMAEHFDSLLALFPSLHSRLAGCAFDSEARGAGPLRQRVSACVAERLALLGDAAGYVDAITGEGISMSLEMVQVLSAMMPQVLEREASMASLLDYQHATERSFRKYAALANALVWLAGRPRLRTSAIELMRARPAMFDWILKRAV